MRAEPIVGHECFCNEIGPLLLHALVEMLAEIAVGPAVEAAILYGREVVRGEIVAKFVALVDDRP